MSHPQKPTRRIDTCYALLFLAGAVIHLLLLRQYLNDFDPPVSDPGVVNHPLTALAAAMYGGLSFAWFMLRVIQRPATQGRAFLFRAILRGALHGALATAVAFELVSVSMAVIVAIQSDSWLAPLHFLFSLIGIGTYGMGIVIESLPLALTYGALTAVLAIWVRRKGDLPSSLVETPGRLTSDSLVLAFLGLLLVFVPILGAILSLMAISTARGALKTLKNSDAVGAGRAKAAIVIGALALAWLVMSVGVFALAFLGLIH